MDDRNFYNRLADIPGMDYESHPDVDRRTLPHHDLRPKFRNSSYGGKQETYVTWEMPNGNSTSRSPAAEWASSAHPDALWPDVLKRLYEVLELPGSASDYHFALLNATEKLWYNRRADPDLLPELERLCLLDIKLIEIRPEIGRMSAGDKTFNLRVAPFRYLIRLYEQDGFIEDALRIARRGMAMGQGSADVERLELRQLGLEMENVE